LDQDQKQSLQIVHELLVEQGDFPSFLIAPSHLPDVPIHRAPLIELNGVPIESSHHAA
jgi:hypothetical protein